MNIITLTLNPAFDLHCYAERFFPYRENVFEITARDAGGKGINVSRALTKNGVKNTAACIIGSENGEEFLKMLKAEGLSLAAVTAEGRIRENITLHEKEKPETRISFPGFACTPSVLSELRSAIGAIGEGSVCVFAGSAPAGLSEETLVSFLKAIKDAGASLVIDSRSVSLPALIDLKPMLIKPNREEAERALGVSIDGIEDAAHAARSLQEKGIENVLLSLGSEGAILAAKEGVYHATAPKVEVLSTIGAGDSTIAGFLSAVAEGFEKEKCLLRAVAYGSAACLLEGTAPPLPEDVVTLEGKITVKRV
ncbi:MAG: 1-phosphofructokinase family hexose kinase [Clostridia bacterium]|nr:1-phosphofructokinase family hexose kinase [Clostridia bacterium]